MKVFLHKDYLNPTTIQCTPLMGQIRKHDLPFHYESTKWEFVSDVKDAQVIPILCDPLHEMYYDNFGLHENIYGFEDQHKFLGNLSNDQWLVILLITHASETTGYVWKENTLKKYEAITKNLILADINNLHNENRHLHYDFMFNFVKSCFIDYDSYDLHQRIFIDPATKDSFVLPEITSFKLKKRFLIPNTIRNTVEYKEIARRRIRSDIINESDCYYSDLQNGIQLEPQEIELMKNVDNNGAGGIPIANHYYLNSAVSVFSETIGSGKNEVHCVTEKSFIPLLKGHFVLPFGYSGLIADIRSYGFWLPEWIDYSYDFIDNDDERLNAFVNSVLKLRSLSLEELETLSNNDIGLRVHNRELFYTRPYDSLYSKLKIRIEQLARIENL